MTAAMNTINIQDGSVRLTNKAGGDPDFTFPLFDVPDANLGYRPTLVFRVDRDWGTSTLELLLNDESVYRETGSYGSGASDHEIVDHDILVATGNKLEAIVTGANPGELRLSDVQMSYQVIA